MFQATVRTAVTVTSWLFGWSLLLSILCFFFFPHIIAECNGKKQCHYSPTRCCQPVFEANFQYFQIRHCPHSEFFWRLTVIGTRSCFQAHSVVIQTCNTAVLQSRLDAGTEGSRTARTGSLFMEDSATTVWSSASLPNMSGSSHMTVGPQADTVDTIDQQSTAKTQQSVSTIGSR